MPDFTNLMLVIALTVLTINGLLMVVPNPATNTYGFGGADTNALSWFIPNEVSAYATIHDFTGQGQGDLNTSGITSVDSGVIESGKIPIISPLVDFFANISSFTLQLFFGLLIALSAAGVPSILVFVIGIPLVAIEFFGVVYLLILIGSIIRGAL